jgi:hypothetical protein
MIVMLPDCGRITAAYVNSTRGTGGTCGPLAWPRRWSSRASTSTRCATCSSVGDIDAAAQRRRARDLQQPAVGSRIDSQPPIPYEPRDPGDTDRLRRCGLCKTPGLPRCSCCDSPAPTSRSVLGFAAGQRRAESRRVGKVVVYPPPSKMSMRRHSMLTPSRTCPREWQAAIIKAERNRPKPRLASSA